MAHKIYGQNVTIISGGGGSHETWLLNETLNSTELSTQNISFQSGGESFAKLKYLNDDAGGYSLFFDDKNVARTIIRTGVTTWYYSENRTITFETSPSGDLLTWLQANATKQ